MSVCWQIMELRSHLPGKSHTTTECGSATSIQPWPISHQGMTTESHRAETNPYRILASTYFILLNIF